MPVEIMLPIGRVVGWIGAPLSSFFFTTTTTSLLAVLERSSSVRVFYYFSTTTYYVSIIGSIGSGSEALESIVFWPYHPSVQRRHLWAKKVKPLGWPRKAYVRLRILKRISNEKNDPLVLQRR